jgi:ferredoxin
MYHAISVAVIIRNREDKLGLKDVINIRCVGCGHCVDSCPVKTLGYSTKFLDWVLIKIEKIKKYNDIRDRD